MIFFVRKNTKGIDTILNRQNEKYRQNLKHTITVHLNCGKIFWCCDNVRKEFCFYIQALNMNSFKDSMFPFEKIHSEEVTSCNSRYPTLSSDVENEAISVYRNKISIDIAIFLHVAKKCVILTSTSQLLQI